MSLYMNNMISDDLHDLFRYQFWYFIFDEFWHQLRLQVAFTSMFARIPFFFFSDMFINGTFIDFQANLLPKVGSGPPPFLLFLFNPFPQGVF